LCFSPVQLENFLWGVQLEVFFPGLAVLALAAVNLSSIPLARKSLCAAVLAFLVTFTVAHGMLLWLLGLPLRARGETISRRRQILIYGAYLLAAAASITAYLVGYQRPAHHPEFLAGHPGILKLAHYLVLWVGSYFNSSLANPFLIGLAAITVLAATLVGVAWSVRKHGAWRPFYPGLLIALYVCVTAGITALGRIGFGVEQALDSRYRTYSLFFYLALLALLFALYCSHFKDSSSARRRPFLLACSALALAAFVAWLGCFRDGLHQQKAIAQRNLPLMRALEWIEVIPDNPKLRELFPLPETLAPRIRLLRDCGILLLPFVPARLAEAVRKEPQPINGQPFGQLETCVIDADHNLRVAGRAELPERKQPPDCIVIGAVDSNGAYKPISILETRRPRGGGKTKAASEARPLFGGTINPANLPPGDITIAAWAIDLQSEKLYPLAGVTFIPAKNR
ncbi:MAG: hypothetical protein ABIR71_03770, partial [Chthoniobacterales bacterium]